VRLPNIKAASIFPTRLADKLEASREKCSERTHLGNGVLHLPILLPAEPNARPAGCNVVIKRTSPQPL
jgi:hypothetical protein